VSFVHHFLHMQSSFKPAFPLTSAVHNRDYDSQGPAGPTAFWKVSDEVDEDKVGASTADPQPLPYLWEWRDESSDEDEEDEEDEEADEDDEDGEEVIEEVIGEVN